MTLTVSTTGQFESEKFQTRRISRPSTEPRAPRIQSRVDTDSATNIGHNEDVGDNYCNVIMNISLRRGDCSISKVP